MSSYATHQVDRVRRLLQANPLLAHTRNAEGWTPTLMASFHDQPEVVEFLVSHGAPVNEVDEDQYHAGVLHWLAQHGRAWVVFQLVKQYGANPNLKVLYTPISILLFFIPFSEAPRQKKKIR